jgi:YcaO-like protein with predicted kinase domain
MTSPAVGATTSKLTFRGTHRVVTPAETVVRARKLFGPLGITRVANVTGLDCIGIPVVLVCRPNARSLAVSQGKGLDLDAARASGLMESLELFHAEHITFPLKLATWNELRFSHNLVEVDALPKVDLGLLHPNHSLLWIEGADLFTGDPTWLPYELVHTNYTIPFPTGTGCFVMSSNGLASGNHVLEAICHGLCEVIERDATTLFRCWTFEHQEQRRVDLSTVSDDDCRRVLSQYAKAGVAVGVWDVTSDVGVATFRCLIGDREPSPFRPLGAVEGMGCHPVREVALLRSLTEAAQGRLTIISGSRDDTGRDRYRQLQQRDVLERARSRLLRDGNRHFEDAPTHLDSTLEGDLAFLLEGLRGAGITRAVVVDLTKPEFGVPVVRVVVPGLEAYHEVQGYIPGERARAALEAARHGADA